MGKGKAVADEINEFFQIWGCREMVAFLNDVVPLLELFDVDDNCDWVRDAVGTDETRNVRLIRAAYLMSKVVDFHCGKLCALKSKHVGLWRKMEKLLEGRENGQTDQEDRERQQESGQGFEEFGEARQEARQGL